MQNLKRNELTEQRLRDLQNQCMVARGEGGGRDREFGMDVSTLLCLKWMMNKDLL